MANTFAAFIFIFCVSSHAENFPLGNDESSMGNTGTALAGSPGGVFYNPALLATLRHSSVSASASTLYLVSMSGSAGKINSYNSVPNSLVSTWKFGSGSFGLSILTPTQVDLDFKSKGKIGTADFQSSFLLKGSSNLYGASWGQLLTTCGTQCAVTGGISLFLNYTTSKTIAETYATTSTESAVINLNKRTESFSLMPILGLYYKTSPSFSMGLRVRPPSVSLKSSVSGDQISQSYDSSGPTNTVKKTALDSDAPDLPQWLGVVGLHWRTGSGLNLLADLQVEERSKPNGTTNAGPTVSVGGNYQVNEKWTALAGASYDWSRQTGSVGETEQRYSVLMITAGLKWKREAFESSVGAFDVRNIGVKPAQSAAALAFDAASFNNMGITIAGIYRFK